MIGTYGGCWPSASRYAAWKSSRGDLFLRTAIRTFIELLAEQTRKTGVEGWATMDRTMGDSQRGHETPTRQPWPSTTAWTTATPASRQAPTKLQNSWKGSGLPPIHPPANAPPERELPLGLYSCAEKRISPLTFKLGKALFLRVEDIGRRRLLTQPRPGRQLPVVSAFRVSEG